MNDDQINAAITEAIDADPHWKCAKNYCNDLNAMAEAENICINTPSLDEEYYHFINRNFRATARQRAEAFLKTLGKWEATTEDSSADEKEVQG